MMYCFAEGPVVYVTNGMELEWLRFMSDILVGGLEFDAPGTKLRLVVLILLGSYTQLIEIIF
jgi:hypothetical protein